MGIVARRTRFIIDRISCINLNSKVVLSIRALYQLHRKSNRYVSRHTIFCDQVQLMQNLRKEVIMKIEDLEEVASEVDKIHHLILCSETTRACN